MNQQDVANILSRLNGMWPRKRAAEEINEWARVLRTLDFATCMGAFDELRDRLDFPPSIADFRSAYRESSISARDERLALPSGDAETDPSLIDRFGPNVSGWVYCWRCDMALTLAERDSCGYDPMRGLFHNDCPPHGSAPTMPSDRASARNTVLAKRKVQVGPSVRPSLYRG